MSLHIEEHFEVPEQEASTTSAGESDSLVTIKRNHEQMDEYKNLKLIRAVNLGLTVGRAASVV